LDLDRERATQEYPQSAVVHQFDRTVFTFRIVTATR
jgi:hypothetical protein